MLRYFTEKYRIKEVTDKFGKTIYIAQVRKYCYWYDIKIHAWSTENKIIIDISELGFGNKCEIREHASSIIDKYDILINSLVKPKTIYKY